MGKYLYLISMVFICSHLLTSCGKVKEKIFLNPQFELNDQVLSKNTFLKDLDKNVSGYKKFEINFETKNLKFNVQVEVFNKGLTLVAMTPIKSRIFVIQYSQGLVRYLPEPYFKAPIRPIYILRDFFLSEISKDRLIKSMPGFEIKEDNTLAKRNREVYFKNEKIIDITYTKKTILFKNILKNYTFKIKTIY